jgi:hypothetical protein
MMARGPFSGFTIERSSDVLTDAGGRTSVVVVELPEVVGGVARSALHRAIQSGASLGEAVRELRDCLASPLLGGARVAIMRFSPDGSVVELLGAGTPPVLCIRPDGASLLYPARSGRVEHGARGAHAVEVLRVKAGSFFMVASVPDGREPDAETVFAAADEVGLGRRGVLLPGEREGSLERVVRIGEPADADVIVAVVDARAEPPRPSPERFS